MPYVSRSRMNAQDFYKQAQAATERAVQQGYGGIGGFLLGASPQEKLQIERASEAEQYALQQQRQRGINSEAGYMAAVASGLDPRAIPGIGEAMAADPQGVLQGLLNNPMAPMQSGNEALRQQAIAQGQEDRAWQMEQRQMERDAFGARIAADQASASASGALKFKEGQALVDTQQQRFLQQIAPAAIVSDATQRVAASLATGNAIGGKAAVIGLAKILDPTSTVREGETTAIEGGTGIGQQLMNAWNRTQGEGFSPESAKALQSVVDANAIPILRRAVQQRQEFSKGLEQVLGADFPGVGRIVTGSGIDWDWVNQYTGTNPAENPAGPRILDYNELKAQ